MSRQKHSSAQSNGSPIADDILRAIRRILRKTAEHSRQLARDGDLSVSGLLCLRQVAQSTRAKPMTVAGVAAGVQLSTATVSRILDRLESAQLIARERDTEDRRRVYLWLTPQGKRHLKSLPLPLQEEFLRQLAKLPKAEQRSLLTALEQIVAMMGAAELDAAPMLTLETDVKLATPR